MAKHSFKAALVAFCYFRRSFTGTAPSATGTVDYSVIIESMVAGIGQSEVAIANGVKNPCIGKNASDIVARAELSVPSRAFPQP